MKPYMTNIWSPISGNSNEDLHENWITGVLNAYEMVHTLYAFNRPTVWQIPRTHEQTLKDYYVLQRTCWASNNNSVKIPGSWCDFNNMPRFFWLHNRLWVSVGPSLIRLHVPEWANLTPDWPQSAVHAMQKGLWHSKVVLT